ncbi:unnamed protein product [Moneuplotes crassus]|uniref:Cyclic nucleotide-binding domain-containing protein n=2 Tax=Euplotes crassus TaxID=5936 RepID=A0AAD1XH65_EUPCR|nr:unnamed protein product [Moneuplotes crassus]
MSSSGTVPNGDESGSNNTSSLKDEIGDDSILNRIDSDTSYVKPALGDKRLSHMTEVPFNKLGTHIPKTAKLDENKDQEEGDGAYLNMPTEANFMRRGTVFESLIGGFGSIDINSQKDSSVKVVGNATKGLGVCKTFQQSSRKSGSDKMDSKSGIRPGEHSYISSVKDADEGESVDESDCSEDSYTKRKTRICFCRAHSQIKIKWEILIMLLATINCFQVPYNVAFSDEAKSNVWYDLFNGLIDVFFMADVVVNFRSSYINESTGEEITESKKIALDYLKGKFWIDLLASIPFDFLSYGLDGLNDNGAILDFVGMLKLVRVLRLSRLITYLNLKNELKMSLKLFKLIFFLFLYLHCLCCLWFYIVKVDKKWIPPLDYVFITTNLFEDGAWFQYSNSLYHAVLMLGGNDVGPRGSFQLLFVFVILILGAIINANIFGNMAVLISAYNRKASIFQEKLETANETMKNLKIPVNIQDDVKSYLTYTQSTLDHQNELDKFLTMLSPSLKREISRHINLDALNQNQVFSNNEEIINAVLNDLDTKLFLPEDEIIRQNSVGDCMYFIAKGEFDVFVTDENKMARFTSSLKNGDYFGEVALLKKCKRTATVKSKNYSTLAELNSTKFQLLIERYPTIKESMHCYLRIQYNDKWKKFMKRSLRNIDYLNMSISDEIVEELAYKLDKTAATQSSVIFKAGNPCNDIHIITSGELDVYVNNNKKDIYLDTLYTGCVIGSYSAITSEYYSITGIAKTDVELLKLRVEDLYDIRQEYDDLDMIISEYEAYCDEYGLPYCDYKLHRNKSLNMTPIEKFRAGIRRIIRIVKSYKSTALTDLLKQVREKIKENKRNKEDQRKLRMRRRSHLSATEKSEQSMIALTEKVERLKDCVEEQATQIENLQTTLISKMEELSLVRLSSTSCSKCGSSDDEDVPVIKLKKKKSKKRKKKAKENLNNSNLSDSSLPANEQVNKIEKRSKKSPEVVKLPTVEKPPKLEQKRGSLPKLKTKKHKSSGKKRDSFGSSVRFKLEEEEEEEDSDDQNSEFTVKLNNKVIHKIDINKKKVGFVLDEDLSPEELRIPDKDHLEGMSEDNMIEQSPYFGDNKLPLLSKTQKAHDPFLTSERAFVKVNSVKKKRRRKDSVIELNNMSL